MHPIHPGEILAEEFLKPMGLTQYRLGIDTGIPHSRITAIAKGRRSITAETAMRLARYFGTTPGFWLNLQKTYDLEIAEDKSAERIAREVTPLAG